MPLNIYTVNTYFSPFKGTSALRAKELIPPQEDIFSQLLFQELLPLTSADGVPARAQLLPHVHRHQGRPLQVADGDDDHDDYDNDDEDDNGDDENFKMNNL